MNESVENRETKVGRAHPRPNQRAWERFHQNRPATMSACFLAAIVLLVTIWPFVSPHDPNALSDNQFQPPSTLHWFGTDVHGRDLFSRVLYGAQISLLVGVVGAAVSLVIGVLWGSIAGYVGGRTDNVMMRFVDMLEAMGSVTLAKFARLIFLFVGLGAVSWLTMARIVRGQVMSLRSRQFIDASRSLGASPVHILARHIIPNVLGVVIVYLTLTVPAVILYESFLSYLGLGIQPPMASWGSLIAEGADQINPIRIYWWLIIFPGGVLVATLLALNFLGDGLRDAWDVRSGK